jgi:effector-binding domain-containing protein
MIQRLALAVFLVCGMATARAQQAPVQPPPVLPPPGSLVTPPAAPNPAQPPAATPPAASPPASSQPGQAPPAPADQTRLPEIGGPTEVMLEAKPVLILRGQSTWDDGFDNLMEAFKRLTSEAAKLKLTVTGRPQAAFTSTDDSGFKYEAMVTLDAAPAARPALPADIELGQSPSGKALKFTHSGAYDDIDTTYEAITAYLDEKGLKARNLFVEEYMTDPKTSEDADLQMNILVLIE